MLKFLASFAAVCVAFLLYSDPSRADCSYASIYLDMANNGLKEAQAYVSEGSDLAKTEFEVATHNLDVASTQLQDCDDVMLNVRYSVIDARRSMVGADAQWLGVYGAAVNIHDALRIMKGHDLDKSDATTYNELQVACKRYYAASNLTWEPIR